ncbi:unnamed protein product [Ranitomeya imitator]|uniref:Uncharacterized protein n=1 Tax=Ranitomeya imitator TaxID=111125 RepID=A0ABN9LG32_9NEOB|nr:unnamed protein product [Ranitomeya imitator]
MAQSEIEAGRLVCLFSDVLVSKNAFYLVCHDSQAELGLFGAHVLSKSLGTAEMAWKNGFGIPSFSYHCHFFFIPCSAALPVQMVFTEAYCSLAAVYIASRLVTNTPYGIYHAYRRNVLSHWLGTYVSWVQ